MKYRIRWWQVWRKRRPNVRYSYKPFRQRPFWEVVMAYRKHFWQIWRWARPYVDFEAILAANEAKCDAECEFIRTASLEELRAKYGEPDGKRPVHLVRYSNI